MPRKRRSSAKPKPPSLPEQRFIQLWGEVAAGTGFSTLEAEVVIPPRKFRYDFRVPGTDVLVEVNGGTYSKQRLGHSTPQGIARDYEKANYCQFKGWRLFTFDTRQVNPTKIQELFNYVCKRYPERI